jgi:predicted esterase
MTIRARRIGTIRTEHLASFLILLAFPLLAGAAGEREEMAERIGKASRLVSESLAMMQTNNCAAAVVSLTEADSLLPGMPIVQYNLACALARTGKPDEATKTLEKAIRNGYSDHAYMQADPDLATLLDRPDFRKLVEMAIEMSKPQPPIVVVPEGYDPNGSRKHPLIVALHGAGARPEQMTRMTGASLPKSDFFVLAPYGSARTGPGFTWTSEDLDAVPKEIARLREKYRIGRVYLFGFSAGAHVGYMMVLKHRETIDGFIPMAGALRTQGLGADQLDKAAGLAAFAIQGKNDEVVSPAAARASLETLNKHGALTKLHEHDGGHSPPADFANVIKEAIAWIDARLDAATPPSSKTVQDRR